LVTLLDSWSGVSDLCAFSASSERVHWEVVRTPWETTNFACRVAVVGDLDGDKVANVLVGEAS